MAPTACPECTTRMHCPETHDFSKEFVMTDPNLPPVTPPPVNQPPANPASSAPAYGQNTGYQQLYANQTGPEKFNVLAIVSFVSSFFIGLVAVITGHIALGQIKKTGEKGRGFAIAGLIIGYVAILVFVVVVVVVVILIALPIALPILYTMFSTSFIVSNGY